MSKYYYIRLLPCLLALVLLIPVAGCDEADPGWVQWGTDEAVKLIDEDGDAFGVKNIDNKLRTSSMPYTYDIAEGNVPNHYPVRRFGHNEDVGLPWETVYELSDLYTYLTAAEQWKIRSSSLSDNATSTGARTLYLEGVDGAYNRVSETISMNGTAYVTTANSYLRMFESWVVDVGAIGANAGNIEYWNNAEAHQLDEMPLGEGQLHTAIFTVPNATTVFYLTDMHMAESTNKGMIFGLWMRKFDESWRLVRIYELVNGIVTIDNNFPLNLEARTDIELRVMGNAAGGTCTGGFNGWYE